MTPFACDLAPLLAWTVDERALAGLPWRDFGNGSAMARVPVRAASPAEPRGASAVLYRIAKDAAPDVFAPHAHPGGELYVVLRGEIVDEHGAYPAGAMVWLEPGSRHRPRGAPGVETLVLVLWPRGVEV